MQRTISIAISILFVVICGCRSGSGPDVDPGPALQTDANGFQYRSNPEDPSKTRVYTLSNGLKVYLRVNTDKPRIQTYIAVKAGSAYDPSETTGLAHYLEHMMFKGTHTIGTKDWKKEKPLLDKISLLYELHKAEQDPAKKMALYKKIDEVSAQAAQYAIANEYDKLTDTLGATGTNAHTSHERTVYINTIPSNELERWLILEKERFSALVLRLFHTELEAVYEEFNRGQDSDGRKHHNALLQGLFAGHPYGMQTTLGKSEHLKNPSMVNIHDYWSRYYVPNNMAFCLSGDLVPEEAIVMINKHWGAKPTGTLPVVEQTKRLKPITAPVVKTVLGPESESLMMGFRFGGEKSRDRLYVAMIDMILANSQAGLIDLSLVQQQRVLRAGCYPHFFNEYGMHVFYGNPREGQSLEQVRDLLLDQIERVKKGDFDEWLPKAIINDMRLSQLRSMENNSFAYKYVMAFVRDIPWQERMDFIDRLATVTRKEIIDFAKKHYQDNYVIVYKRTGTDPSVVKLEKPSITPVPINRTDQSPFFDKFRQLPSTRLNPSFLDYDKSITTCEFTKDIPLHYIENRINPLFRLHYIVDIGTEHSKKIPLAVSYLPLIGTDRYTAAQLRQELYRLGLTFNVSTGDSRLHITINGLEENMEQGVALLEHIISAAKPDSEAYRNYVDSILKKRANKKKDKQTILRWGMVSYAKYGPKSPFTDILTEKQLRAIDPQELVDLVHGLCSYKHRIFYYGQEPADLVLATLKSIHKVPAAPEPTPANQNFSELAMDKNQVLFVDFDMVQTMILMLSKDEPFNKDLMAHASLFNSYYGGSMSSIVFQEIRESKALAYVAYAIFSQPRRPDRSHYTYAFVGTQADKMQAATDAMLELMNTMPAVQTSFDLAKSATLRRTESERITRDSVFWKWLANQQMGLPSSIRKTVYETTKTIELKDINDFFDKHIKGKKYTFLVMGSKKLVDMKALEKLGPVTELELSKIFGY